MSHAALNPARVFADVTRLYLKNPLNPWHHTTFGKTLAAQTESGNYRGPIIGETEHHIIQRQSTRTSIAHPKDMLDRQPQIGESVRINYSDSKAAVREFRERAKAQDRDR